MGSNRESNGTPLVLGIDIGGTKTSVSVGTEQGEILGRHAWPTEADRGPEPLIDEMVRHGRAMIDKHGATRCGVGAPGPMDARKGIIHQPPNMPGWDAIPLEQILQEKLDVPVNVEHDAAACALAEWKWGSGRSLDPQASLVYLTSGTGMGAGYVFGGRLHRGAGGRSPELGHVKLTDEGPEAFGMVGCVEAWCAGKSLPRVAAWLYPERWGKNGSEKAPEGPKLIELTEQGDDQARAVLAKNAEMTGRTCALVGDGVGPDVIALGSLARHIGDWWVQAVVKSFRDYALEATAERVRVKPAALGHELQDLAAVAVGLEQEAQHA